MDKAMDDAADQRTCERTGLRRPVVVAPAGGTAVAGTLVNVSLGGVLVELAERSAGFSLGQAIELRLSTAQQGRPYACEVVRVDAGLLGLAIDRKAAAKFGLEITRGMFSRKPDA
jgi:hypothetical protein